MDARGSIELWGGIESTVARLGDRYRDQVVETGHRERAADLDLIAGLGIRTLRYPVLWETIAPDDPGRSDFGWHDGRLRRLRELGIAPIAGLIHHGSGPRYTSLLDPDFPRLFARHAARVARRYPWIDLYTPVNEPLTTARFTSLYGHWHPHMRDHRAFLTALVAQCRATVLAMRAIRRVNPGARLVQTEDLGRVFATPALASQAEHENERRWLTFDLLFGRVDRHHPWHRVFLANGISDRHLRSLAEGEGRPDIVGINHYLTSERFLDERLERYPSHLAGGNGRQAYADVEAVRVRLPRGALGPAARLREVWARYRTPIAVTEVHHGSTRDEQLRWIAEVWRAAGRVRREGADIRAVTAWSLFGTVDWNSLLTRDQGIYEPGAFDVRGPKPRATALAHAVSALATHGRFSHPALATPGWWRRDSRLYARDDLGVAVSRGRARAPPALLLVGPDGPLRRGLVDCAHRRGLACRSIETGRPPAAAVAWLRSGEVWAVVDVEAAAGTGQASRDELAASCAERGRPYLLFSSARVFDPSLREACGEDARACPVDRAGRDAVSRETELLAAHPGALILRAGPIFGAGWPVGPISDLLADVVAGYSIGDGDRVISPSFLPDLCHVALDLLIDRESGVRHLVNGVTTRREFADALAARLGFAPPAADAGLSSSADETPLVTGKGGLMPPLESALARWVAELPDDRRVRTVAFQVAAE